VQKDPATSLYSPTMKMWEMGSLLVRDTDLVAVANPRLRRLCDETHESVQLTVFDAGYVVYVDKVDSAQPLKAMTTIGSRVPASATSTGKAMLAWMPPEALDMAFAHVKRFTPLTLMRRRDIEADLEETRARGFSINRGEFRLGVCGIGVPVRDRTGSVVAAIGVWGAETNILGPAREELAQLSLSAARDISRALGYIESEVAKARPAVEAAELVT
jgi:DNA-binding IclR family transcriptional regulator